MFLQVFMWLLIVGVSGLIIYWFAKEEEDKSLPVICALAWLMIGWGLMGNGICVRSELAKEPYLLVRTEKAAYVIRSGQTAPYVVKDLKQYHTIDNTNIVWEVNYNMYDGVRDVTIKE